MRVLEQAVSAPANFLRRLLQTETAGSDAYMKRLFIFCLLVCLLLLSLGSVRSAAAAQKNTGGTNAGIVYEAQAEEDVLTEAAAAEPPIMPLTGNFSLAMVLMISALTVGCVMFSLHKKRRA